MDFGEKRRTTHLYWNNNFRVKRPRDDLSLYYELSNSIKTLTDLK